MERDRFLIRRKISDGSEWLEGGVEVEEGLSPLDGEIFMLSGSREETSSYSNGGAAIRRLSMDPAHFGLNLALILECLWLLWCRRRELWRKSSLSLTLIALRSLLSLL